MLSFFEQHPQPKGASGKVYFHDESRFTRALTNGEIDLAASQEMVIRFAKAGWHIVFITRKETGNPVIDSIMNTLAFANASDYLVKLSANVVRGRAHWGAQGYWLGGPAPFPTQRVEANTRRTLTLGVKSTEKCVLQVDPQKLPHWIRAAEMVLNGSTITDVQRYFIEHVPTLSKKPQSIWNHSAVRKMLTNRVLVGELNYALKGERQIVKAQWPPLVPIALFDRVSEELERRRTGGNLPGRRKNSTYPLQLTRCAECGVRLRGQVNDGVRFYRHPSIKAHYIPKEIVDRAVAAGCRSFTLDAAELEFRIAKTIAVGRLQDEAIQTVRKCFDEDQESERATARDRLDTLGAAVSRLRKQYENSREAIREVNASALRKDLLADAAELGRELQERESQYSTTLRHMHEDEQAVDELEYRLKTSNDVIARWHQASIDEQQVIFDWWVDELSVSVKYSGLTRAPRHRLAVVGLSLLPRGVGQRQIEVAPRNSRANSGLRSAASYVVTRCSVSSI